jgi:hypothetical protein
MNSGPVTGAGIGGGAPVVIPGRYDKALAAAELVCEYDDVGVLGWSLTELVEAAVRGGQPARASEALQRLSETTRASGTGWALGNEARHDGHRGFAERARRELLVTGDTVRKRRVETVSDITAQEAHIARLAVGGRTNVGSGPSCSSAPGPSNGISARCTPSSVSARAESYGRLWPASGRPTRRPSDRQPGHRPATLARPAHLPVLRRRRRQPHGRQACLARGAPLG